MLLLIQPQTLLETDGLSNNIKTALDNGNTFIASNYATYALDNGKNGCGVPVITQIYRGGTEQMDRSE